MHGLRSVAMIGLLVWLATPTVALAQAGEFIPIATFDTQFNLSNPGARNLGMGGAFVGRADDATAAYANPAGLCLLSRSEVSIEGRSWQYEAEINFPGTFGAIAPQTVEPETSGVSFLSVVFPWKRWTFSAYRHQLADTSIEAVGQDDCLSADFLPCIEIAGTNVEVVGYSVATAYRFDGGLSLGLGVVLYDTTVNIETRGTTFDFTGNPQEPVYQQMSQNLDSTETAVIAGVLWQVNRNWSLGAVYRQGSEFDIVGTIEQTSLEDGDTERFEEAQVSSIPDIWAIGVGFSPTSQLTLNLELTHIEYSQFLGGADIVVASPLTGHVVGTLLIDDVDEFHIGLEYSFWNVRGAPALRLGAWYDPDHRLRFEPSSENLGALDDQARASASAALPGGEDQIHISAGIGVMIQGRFQIDAAVDFSDTTRTFSLSSLVRF